MEKISTKYILNQISDACIEIKQYELKELADFTMETFQKISILKLNQINVVPMLSTDGRQNNQISGFTFLSPFTANVTLMMKTTLLTNETPADELIPVKSDELIPVKSDELIPVKSDELIPLNLVSGMEMIVENMNTFEFDGKKTDFETFMQLSIQLIKN
jgi:hypothetical protein